MNDRLPSPPASPNLAECPACNYSLHGLPAIHRCPECGFEYDEETTVWRPSARRLWIGGILFLLFAAFTMSSMVLSPPRSGSRSLLSIVLDYWLVLYVLAFPAWLAWALRRRPFVAVGRQSFAIRYRRHEVQVIPWERVRTIRNSTLLRNRIIVIAATAESFRTEQEITESYTIPDLIPSPGQTWLLYGALTRAWQEHALREKPSGVREILNR